MSTPIYPYHHPIRRLVSKSNDSIFERRSEFNNGVYHRRASEYSINHGNGYTLPLSRPQSGSSSTTVVDLNNSISRESMLEPSQSSNIYSTQPSEGGEYIYTDHFGPDPAHQGCCSETWCLTRYGPDCLPIRASFISLIETFKPYIKYILILAAAQLSTLIIVALSQNKSDAVPPPVPPPG